MKKKNFSEHSGHLPKKIIVSMSLKLMAKLFRKLQLFLPDCKLRPDDLIVPKLKGRKKREVKIRKWIFSAKQEKEILRKDPDLEKCIFQQVSFWCVLAGIVSGHWQVQEGTENHLTKALKHEVATFHVYLTLPETQ